MTDQNKIKGKALQKVLREKRRQELLSEMPIGVDELKNLVEIIESAGCDHTLSATEMFLQNNKNVKTILAWFNAHGGYCDCEVVMNVVLGHLAELDIIPPEETPPETELQAMFSMKFTKNENLNSAKGPLDTNHIRLEKIPSPWKLYLQPNLKLLDKAHLCFGSKGMRSECKLSYYASRPAIMRASANLPQLWKMITGVTPTYPIEIENDTIALQNGELIGTLLSQPGYLSIFGCYTTNQNPNWHFVFTTTCTRKKGDLAEIKKLLKEAQLK